MRGTVVLGWSLVAIALGCGGAETGVGGAGGAGAGGVGVGGTISTTSTTSSTGGEDCQIGACPAGEAPDSSGACVPVGIQGCAPVFVDPDGVCRPSMKKCAGQPGTIPRFAEGCVEVGVPGCAPEHLEEDGLCHPAMSKCPTGTFAIPQEGCVPIDGPEGCGSGTWGDIPDTPETRYVDPAFAGPTSDGTQAKPYKSLKSAVASVPEGSIVALAAGAYLESIQLTGKPLTIVGRCPSMSIVTPPTDMQSAFLLLNTTGVTIRRLTVSGGTRGIFAVGSTGVSIEEVHVLGSAAAGIYAGSASDVTLDHVLVSDAISFNQGGEIGVGVGLFALTGTTVAVKRSAFVNNLFEGIDAMSPGTVVTVEDSLIEGTRSDALFGFEGSGMRATGGASLTVITSAIVANHAAGVCGFDPGTMVEIARSHIEGTQPEPASGRLGCGANAQRGAHLRVSGTTVLRNTYNGLLAFSEESPSVLDSRENLVAWTEFPGESRFGLGAVVQQHAAATFQDDVFFENHTGGVFLYSGNATANLQRVLIEHTLPSKETGQDGGGALAYLSGSLTLDSCAVVDNHVGGVGIVLTPGSITHSLLSGTSAGSILDEQGVLHQDFGDGLLAHLTEVTLEASVLENNARAGLLFNGSGGVVRTSEVRGNHYGVVLQSGAEVDFESATCNLSGACSHLVVDDGDLKVPSAPTDF